MKIKHKLTNQVVELTFRDWEDNYLPKKLDENYEIIDQDLVFIRLIKKNGTRDLFKMFERDQALKMVLNKPMEYDFIDIDGGKIVEGKIVELENPTFKIFPKESWIEWLKELNVIIKGILMAGIGGLLTWFLIKIFN